MENVKQEQPPTVDVGGPGFSRHLELPRGNLVGWKSVLLSLRFRCLLSSHFSFAFMIIFSIFSFSIAVFLLFSFSLSSDIPVSIPSCTLPNYYDHSSLACIECIENDRAPSLASGYAYCSCEPGSIKSYLRDDDTYVCRECTLTGVSDSTRTVCMGCDPATTDASSHDCTCKDSKYRLIERNPYTDEFLSNKTCVPCPYNQKVNFPDNPYECVLKCDSSRIYDSITDLCTDCAPHLQSLLWQPGNTDPVYVARGDDKCVIDVSGGSSWNGGIEVKSIQDYVGSTESNEDLFSVVAKEVYDEAVGKCVIEQHGESCNIIANLCVLMLYDENRQPCITYQNQLNTYEIQNVYSSGPLYSGWQRGFPWLSYEEKMRELVLKDRTATVTPVGYTSSKVGEFSFYVSRYDALTGKFLGLRGISPGDLSLCTFDGNVETGSRRDESVWAKLGTNYKTSCYLNVLHLRELPPTEIWELYFRDGNSETTGVLKPVPIQVLDYNNAKIRHDYLVRDTTDATVQTLTLRRRFFLYDNVFEPEQFLRYVEKAHIQMTLVTGSDTMYIPFLTLKYAARKVQDLVSVGNYTTASSLTLSSPKIEFSVEYDQEYDTFYITILILMCLLIVGSSIGTCLCSMLQRVEIEFDIAFLIRLLVAVCSAVANSLYAIIIFVSLWYFFFFKLQGLVFVMLPTEWQNLGYYIILPIAVVLKGIDILYNLWVTTHYDIFFIDWEKSRRQISAGKQRKEVVVSCWRTYHVAREWLRLTDESFVSYEFLLLFLVFVLSGFKLENLANEVHSGSLSDDYPTNSILRFAVSWLFITLFGLIQYLYKRIFHYRFVRDPVTNFIDLCCLSNVSVLVLPESHKGYYIHGKSVHSFADVDMQTLEKNLLEEEESRVSQRGLAPSRPDGPTTVFEIYISPEFRDMYSVHITAPRQAEETKIRRRGPARRQQREVHLDRNTIANLRFYKLLYPENLVGRVGRLFQKYQKANEKLQERISYIKDHEEEHLMPRGLLNKLGFPPKRGIKTQGGQASSGSGSGSAPGGANKDIFLVDFSNAFTRLFIRGCELKYLMFYTLLFNVFDMFLKNAVFAALIVYAVYFILRGLRHNLNFRNLHYRTLLDSRLLV